LSLLKQQAEGMMAGLKEIQKRISQLEKEK
jgi:hypothetical protein